MSGSREATLPIHNMAEEGRIPVSQKNPSNHPNYKQKGWPNTTGRDPTPTQIMNPLSHTVPYSQEAIFWRGTDKENRTTKGPPSCQGTPSRTMWHSSHWESLWKVLMTPQCPLEPGHVPSRRHSSQRNWHFLGHNWRGWEVRWFLCSGCSSHILSPGLGTSRRGADRKDTAGVDALETNTDHRGTLVPRLCRDAIDNSE